MEETVYTKYYSLYNIITCTACSGCSCFGLKLRHYLPFMALLCLVVCILDDSFTWAVPFSALGYIIRLGVYT